MGQCRINALNAQKLNPRRAEWHPASIQKQGDLARSGGHAVFHLVIKLCGGFQAHPSASFHRRGSSLSPAHRFGIQQKQGSNRHTPAPPGWDGITGAHLARTRASDGAEVSLEKGGDKVQREKEKRPPTVDSFNGLCSTCKIAR